MAVPTGQEAFCWRSVLCFFLEFRLIFGCVCFTKKKRFPICSSCDRLKSHQCSFSSLIRTLKNLFKRITPYFDSYIYVPIATVIMNVSVELLPPFGHVLVRRSAVVIFSACCFCTCWSLYRWSRCGVSLFVILHNQCYTVNVRPIGELSCYCV